MLCVCLVQTKIYIYVSMKLVEVELRRYIHDRGPVKCNKDNEKLAF